MDEFLDPHDIDRQSLAEANIIEQIRNNIKTLIEGISNLETLFSSISNKTLYETSNILEKILNLKDELFEANVRLMSYLSRVGIGIYKRDLYIGVINNLIDFGEKIGEVGLMLKIIAEIPLDPPQSYMATIRKILGDIDNQVKMLDRLLHKLNVGSHDIDHELNEIRKYEEDIDQIFKEIYPEIYKDLLDRPQLLYIFKELIYMLEKLSDNAWRIALYMNMIIES
jgi:archaellum component FlaC